jgi:hypothetical protein
MFTTLAKQFFPARPDAVFTVHPIQLSRWLDEAWTAARGAVVLDVQGNFLSVFPAEVIGAFDLPTQAPPDFLVPSGINRQGTFEWNGKPADFECAAPPWHHLAYAYLLESTGMLEIFAEVVRRLLVGESLGALRSPEAAAWLRATEQLFFGPAAPYSVTGVSSELRPYERLNRRNAYQRLLGLALPHEVPKPYEGSGPLADWRAHTGTANTDFPQKWNELLRQIWLGIENRRNGSGPNPADPSFIALLCRAIADGMANRRRAGALFREEFAYVSMASWFHLTLTTKDVPVLAELQVSANNPAEQLAGLAQRVGMTPAARSRELFDLAEPMATVLRGIEIGLFSDQTGAAALFEEGSVLANDMADIINNWQSATGHRVKERPIGTTVTGSGQPLRVPTPGVTAPAPTGNGNDPSANGNVPAVAT